MYSYCRMWRISISAAKWTFLTFCFCVPSLWHPFIPFPSSLFHLESTLFGMRDLLFVLLGFPGHASLRDISPESSEPFVTLDSSKFAEKNHIRSSHLFLPKFTLESISYSLVFRGYLKNFVSQIRCAARRDIMCLLSPSEKSSEELSWDLFIGENSCVRLYWNTEFRPSLQYQYNWICFCLRCFGFSPILSPHRIFRRRSFDKKCEFWK